MWVREVKLDVRWCDWVWRIVGSERRSFRLYVVRSDIYRWEWGFVSCSRGTLEDEAMTSVRCETSVNRDVFCKGAGDVSSSIIYAYSADTRSVYATLCGTSSVAWVWRS